MEKVGYLEKKMNAFAELPKLYFSSDLEDLLRFILISRTKTKVI
jgi:hypothetical protein